MRFQKTLRKISTQWDQFLKFCQWTQEDRRRQMLLTKSTEINCAKINKEELVRATFQIPGMLLIQQQRNVRDLTRAWKLQGWLFVWRHWADWWAEESVEVPGSSNCRLQKEDEATGGVHCQASPRSKSSAGRDFSPTIDLWGFTKGKGKEPPRNSIQVKILFTKKG